MIYVTGILGFLGGFALALLILNHLLREQSREDLLKDKSLQLKFGGLAWLIAILSSWCAVWMYRIYFPEVPPLP